MYLLELSRTAEAFYTWLYKRDRRFFERIRQVFISLKEDPFQGKPLKGELKGCYSYRLGSYRVIYQVVKEDKKILILDIAHRREVYR